MKGLIRDLRQQYGAKIQELLPKMREPREIDRGPLIELERRGAASQRLLEDGELKRVLDAVEAVYMNAWRGSAVSEVELREKAHCAVNVLDDIRNRMKADVAAGDAAARQLEAIANTPTK